MTISNCSHDENGHFRGGEPGDQTGTEWELCDWYNRPWDMALEPPSREIGEDIALLAIHAAQNNHIGYDQIDRLTFYHCLMDVENYDPANITTDCDADCSSGVSAIVIASGKRTGDADCASVPPNMRTRNMEPNLLAAGWKKHDDPAYRESDKYLGKGWILLLVGEHTVIQVTDGEKFGQAPSAEDEIPDSEKYPRKYEPGTYIITAPHLKVRLGAGTRYRVKEASELTPEAREHANEKGELLKGTTVDVFRISRSTLGNWWGKTPTGWICLEWKGKPYVEGGN